MKAWLLLRKILPPTRGREDQLAAGRRRGLGDRQGEGVDQGDAGVRRGREGLERAEERVGVRGLVEGRGDRIEPDRTPPWLSRAVPEEPNVPDVE